MMCFNKDLINCHRYVICDVGYYFIAGRHLCFRTRNEASRNGYKAEKNDRQRSAIGSFNFKSAVLNRNYCSVWHDYFCNRSR